MDSPERTSEQSSPPAENDASLFRNADDSGERGRRHDARRCSRAGRLLAVYGGQA